MKESPYSEQRQLFAEMLREARAASGLTQVELSGRIGWPQSDVSKVERGVRKIDVVELRAWLLGLGLSLEQFSAALDRRLAGRDSLRSQWSTKAKAGRLPRKTR